MIIVPARWALYILLMTGIIAGCREEDPEVINKLDPQLKMQVDKIQNAPLSVVLRTTAELTDAQRKTLESYLVVIQSHVGTIYVCEIPFQSVLDVAREKFVVRLEAPKTLNPL
jgi:type IV pilus biogenesis protein CpaD/CtpE